ncbi:MAG: hemerythrin domain-containing protein [Thermoplasmata archaeon]
MSLLDVLKFKGSFVTQILRDQHKNTVELCEKFLDKKLNNEEFLKHIEFLLNIHFKIEEDILYPAFLPILQKYLPYMEPFKMVIAEHRGVVNLLNKYNNFHEEHDYLSDIANLLLQHVYKEENGIFNQIDILMPEDIKIQVYDKIKKFIEK